MEIPERVLEQKSRLKRIAQFMETPSCSSAAERGHSRRRIPIAQANPSAGQNGLMRISLKPLLKTSRRNPSKVRTPYNDGRFESVSRKVGLSAFELHLEELTNCEGF